MTPKFWLITGAVLFLGGTSLAVCQLGSAFRALAAAPSIGDPEVRSMPIGGMLLPIGIAVIGLMVGAAAIAHMYFRKSR